MDKRLFIIVAACVMISAIFLVLLYYYFVGDSHHSTVKFSVDADEEVEFILKVEPMGILQYSQEHPIYYEDQEERAKDKYLNLTQNKQLRKMLEKELTYTVEVYQTDLVKEPDERFYLHQNLGDLIHSEEILVTRRTSHKISIE
ncbi:hypothetical protein [Alkalicoccobacillus porphyridii]|uniref:Uncharacterized protein n=1 Tax=Alkalicoccobacillus porphyridii TaxID=2597270 RepID=A0A554A229_9BACI|nr:hypothetical protein [Alkalicoccobacillus porphyridii]TSB47747.1 hypothetical protein FN960_04315 [Alkalicoccobacillus porphyridii]